METRAPDDLQRIDVNPDQFGASIGQGLQQLGAGAQKAQQFWGQVQTDKSMNDVLAQGDSIVSDFKNLKGQDALNAQQDTQAKLDAAVAAGRANLSSPEQQLEYDRQVRPYQQRYWSGQMSAHAQQQGQAFTAATNNDAYQLAVNRASNVYSNPNDLRSAWDDAYGARLKSLQSEGLATPAGIIDARNQAGRDVYKTAAQAMAVKDPVAAAKLVESNKELLGPEYAPLADGLRARATDQAARDLLSSSHQGAQQATSGNQTSPAAAAPMPTFAGMAPPYQDGTSPAAPAPATNGLPQEGPMPPARGDGGPAPSAATGNARPVSDSAALMASQRIALGHETDGDRALLGRYHEEQGTPQEQRQNGIHLPPNMTQPLPPPRGADGTVSQPTYQAWRSTLSKQDQVDFDKIALRDATTKGSTLPAMQQKLFATISDRATAQGTALPGAVAPAAAAPQAVTSPAAPPASQTAAGFSTLDAVRAARPAEPYSPAAYDDWSSKLSRNDRASFDDLVAQKQRQQGVTQDAARKQVFDAMQAAYVRGDVPRPLDAVPHPATMRLPAAPTYDHADTSTSLPKPVGGSAAMPYFSQAGAGYGISGNFLGRTAQLESGGRGNATSPTGAAGLFQFTRGTWAKYGNGGNPYDTNASTMAAVRLAADNKMGLTRTLGREPSDAELYLAHQQGLAGASALLRNPNLAAADALAPAYQGSRAAAARAISVNGGNPEASAATFSQLWINKFNGVTPKGGALPFFVAGAGGFQGGAYAAASPTPFTNTVPDTIAAPPAPTAPVDPAPAAPASPPTLMEQAGSGAQVPPPAPVAAEQPRSLEAETYARIQASGQPDEVKTRAFALAHQQFAEDQIADQQNATARKARSEKARDGYVQRLLLGDTGGMLQQVARDPNLEPETRWTLGQAVEKHAADMNGGENPKSWGPGFGRAYDRLMAFPGDPNRLQSADQIYHMVGPDSGLSLAGAAKLDGVRKSMLRSTDDHAVETARAGVLKAMHDRMSFDSPDIHLRDHRGESAYNEQFLPQYMAGFDKWVEAGNSPMDYIKDTKSAETLADRLRPRQQMEADRIAAGADQGMPPTRETAPNPFEGGGGVQAPAEPPPQPNPSLPAPPSADANGWSAVMTNLPPSTPGQKPFTADDWAAAVQRLAADPSPENIQRWNASKLGRAGYDAAAVLHHVRPDVKVAPPPAPRMDLDLSQMGP